MPDNNSLSEVSWRQSRSDTDFSPSLESKFLVPILSRSQRLPSSTDTNMLLYPPPDRKFSQVNQMLPWSVPTLGLPALSNPPLPIANNSRFDSNSKEVNMMTVDSQDTKARAVVGPYGHLSCRPMLRISHSAFQGGPQSLQTPFPYHRNPRPTVSFYS